MVKSRFQYKLSLNRPGALFLAGLLLISPGFGGASMKRPATESLRSAKGTQIITLGTSGGPIVRVRRASEATLLVVDGRVYMIDCGEGAVRRLVEAGFSPSDVGKLFLTHQHMDHVLDLPSLLAYDWQFDDRRKIDVFGPAGVSMTVAAALQFLEVGEKLFSPQMPPHPPMREIVHVTELGAITQPTEVYKDDKVRVLAVENSHYSQLPPTGLPFVPRSYSYRFETATRTVVFTGDTGPSAALTALAKGADVLVSEVVQPDAMISYLRKKTNGDERALARVIDHLRHEHLTPDEVGKLAAAAAVKKVVLSHIVPGADDETSERPYVVGIKRYFKGSIKVARDLAAY